MINNYHWELYKKSDGKDTIASWEMFLQGKDYDTGKNKFVKLHERYCPDPELTKYLKDSLSDSIDYLTSEEYLSFEDEIMETEITVDNALEALWQTLIEENKFDEKKAALHFIDDIEFLTLNLSYNYPDLFVPYFYRCLYNVFSDICNHFKITIGKNYSKNQYKERFWHYADICKELHNKERFWHYADICKELHKFREENNFTVPELWAFLYEYANNVIGLKTWLSDISGQPRRAFFIGGNKVKNGDDIVVEKYATKNSNAYFWHANPEAERDDIHILYLVAPVSSIQYVMQAASDGFVDPFTAWYSYIYLSNTIKVPIVTLKEMKDDPNINKIPLVKANMQGINGRELTTAQYNMIKNKFIEKGFNENALSQLREDSIVGSDVQNERDVEVKYVDNLLKILDYQVSDYTRQMVIKMGVSEKVIPDYVIHPKFEKGKEKGEFIIEAKYSISTKKHLEIALAQARSYARRLNAEGIIIVAKQGLWLAQKLDDFSATQSYAWNEFKNQDNVNAVYKIFGNKRKKKD